MPLPSTWIEIELNPEELVLWMSPFTQSQLSDLRSAETEEDIQKVLAELYEEDPGLRDFISDVEECAKKFELNFGFLSDDIALLRGSSKSIRACHAYLETIARDCQILTAEEFNNRFCEKDEGELPPTSGMSYE